MFNRQLYLPDDFTTLDAKSAELAVQSIAFKATAHNPACILAPIRGGLVPGVMLSHKMKIPMFALNFSLRDFKIVEDVPRSLLDYIARSENKTILLVDDIVDGGTTFKHLIEILNDEIPNIDLITSALLVNTEQSIKIDCPGFTFQRSKNSNFFDFYWEL